MFQKIKLKFLYLLNHLRTEKMFFSLCKMYLFYQSSLAVEYIYISPENIVLNSAESEFINNYIMMSITKIKKLRFKFIHRVKNKDFEYYSININDVYIEKMFIFILDDGGNSSFLRYYSFDLDKLISRWFNEFVYKDIKEIEKINIFTWENLIETLIKIENDLITNFINFLKSCKENEKRAEIHFFILKNQEKKLKNLNFKFKDITYDNIQVTHKNFDFFIFILDKLIEIVKNIQSGRIHIFFKFEANSLLDAYFFNCILNNLIPNMNNLCIFLQKNIKNITDSLFLDDSTFIELKTILMKYNIRLYLFTSNEYKSYLYRLNVFKYIFGENYKNARYYESVMYPIDFILKVCFEKIMNILYVDELNISKIAETSQE